MGVNLTELIEKEKINIQQLNARTIAVDAFNSLYQFLSTIRQYDGTPLMNTQGQVTSHLSGLFYRTTKLIENEIKPVYVFDGKPPELKHNTINERIQAKKQALEKYEKAKAKQDFAEMKKYAQATSRLTSEMISESKELLKAMGLPIIQAPGEGEAQAALMTIEGKCWASASQDFDSLLFGSPKLIRNMTISGRRKLPGKQIYILVEPELIKLNYNLKKMSITREQLVEIGLMIGTDFNKGIKGIGPKKALEAVKQGKTIEKVAKEMNTTIEVEPQQLRNIFLKPNVTTNYKIEFKKPNPEKITEILVEKNDFSKQRIQNSINKLIKFSETKNTQSKLDNWF